MRLKTKLVLAITGLVFLIAGLLSLVYVFTGLGSFLVALHQLAFAVTIGFDKLYAAEVLGMGALLSLPCSSLR